MKHRRLIIQMLILLLLSTAQSQAHQEQNKRESNISQSSGQITPEEIKQAEALANRFIKRFTETRDLTPIVDEMFTSSFKTKVMQDDSWSGIVGQRRSLVEHLKDQERLRCYVVQFSLQYILRLYLASKDSLDSANQVQPESLFPPKIIQFFKDKAPPDAEIKSAEQAHRVLLFLEQSLILMQEEVRKNPPEETAQFKKNLEAFEIHLRENLKEQPSGTVYEEERFGSPAGTRLVRILIPFHVGLVMVKEKNEFKIDLAATHLPPD